MALDKINFEFKIGNYLFEGKNIQSCMITKYIGSNKDVIEIPKIILGTPVKFISKKFWETIPEIKKLILPSTLITLCYDGNKELCAPNRSHLNKLEHIYVDVGNLLMHSEEGVLYICGPNKHNKKDNSTLYIYPPNKPNKEFQIPNWCTKVFDHSFEESNNLVTVKLNLVSSIGKYSFINCLGLKNIKLSKVKYIYEYAFYNCSNIEEIALLSAEKIGNNAFGLCKRLQSVSIGNDQIDFDFNCLRKCNELKEINIYGKACKRFTVIDDILYNFSKKIEPVFCPSNNYRKDISILPYVDYFNSYVFYECKNIKIVRYNSKTDFKRNRLGNKSFLERVYYEKHLVPLKNNGYLLYVPGPVVDFLDLSDIHDFGDIAFRDVKRIRHMRIGDLLSENKIKEILQLANVDEIVDCPNTIIQKKLDSPISNTETKEEPLPAKKGKKVVVPKYNIIIVSQKFRCIREGHKLEDVRIQVRLLHHGNISVLPIAGGYCSSCKRYYIYSEVFDNFLKGLRPGTVILQNRFKAPNGMYGEVYDVTAGLRSQSLLNRCGYSVSYNNGLSDGSRIELLRQIINSKLMTKQEVMSYLNYFINFNGKKSGNEYAKKMWVKDLMALSKI